LCLKCYWADRHGLKWVFQKSILSALLGHKKAN
jgi:hypothetical protein